MRAATLAKVAAAAHHLADALSELARQEAGETSRPSSIPIQRSRRGRVRVPPDAPILVDDLTAKKAEAALRRAGIPTR
jgi:hypothetical protein